MFLDFGYIFQHFCSQTSAAPESLPQRKKKSALAEGNHDTEMNNYHAVQQFYIFTF